MKRREFITLLGGAATAWPLAARGQQAGMRRVGVFMRLSQSDPVTKGYLAALAQGLAPLGWSQSRNLQLLFRISGGDDPTANAAAADLVRQNPEVILSHGTETSRIVQQHTSAIPIVFTTVTDPVGSGLVESLARPRAPSHRGYFFIVSRSFIQAAIPARADFSSTPSGNPATPTPPTSWPSTASGTPPPTR